MRCPNHPDRIAERRCAVCGAWSCADCAPSGPGLGEPVCLRCAASLAPAPPAPDRGARRLGQRLLPGLALLAAVLGAAGLGRHLARPSEAERLADALRALELCGGALERYHERTGGWPDRLEELLGAELEALPPDPFGAPGAHLRYVAPAGNPGGRVLYSVGPDGRDQGGLPPDPLGGPGDLPYPVR